MKTVILIWGISIASITLISCNSGNKNQRKAERKAEIKQRFTTQSDTFYKDNSLDVEWVNRTFYRMANNQGGLNERELSISKFIHEKFGDPYLLGDYYNLMLCVGAAPKVMRGYVQISSDRSLKNFFKSMRTVASNRDKILHYTFGDHDEGSIIADPSSDGVQLYIKVSNDYENISIVKSEIDSMESCYNRYLNEE